MLKCLVLVLVAVNWSAAYAQEDSTHPRGLPTDATFDGADVRDIFLSFFRHINASFVLDPKVHGHVTADYKGIDTFDILDDVARRVNAVIVEKTGIYCIIADENNPPKKEDPRAVGSYVFRFEGRPVRVALQALFDVCGSGRATGLEVNADGNISISGSFDSFTDAVKAVSDGIGATLSITRSNYYVARSHSWPAWEHSRVSLKKDRADIRDTLRELFRQINVNYSIAPEVQGTISCDIGGDAVEVLPRLLAAVNSYYRIESGVVQIVREPGMPSEKRRTTRVAPPVPFLPSVDMPARFQKVVTPAGLVYKERNLHEVLLSIFTRIPNRFLLPANLSTRFTGNLSSMSLYQALHEICSQAKLNVKFEKEVFVFTRGSFIPPGIEIGGGPIDWIIKGGPRRGGWVVGNPPPSP